MQSAGPVLEEWQAIHLSFMFKGSEFGHWKVSGGQDAFAFRHPSLEQAAVWQLLEGEAHHHKVHPIGAGRLIALVGVTQISDPPQNQLQIVFGLVLYIHPRQSKSKNEHLCFTLPLTQVTRAASATGRLPSQAGPAKPYHSARAKMKIGKDRKLRGNPRVLDIKYKNPQGDSFNSSLF